MKDFDLICTDTIAEDEIDAIKTTAGQHDAIQNNPSHIGPHHGANDVVGLHFPR